MPCSLTQAIATDCRNSVGGIRKIAVTEIGNITAIVTGSEGGLITSMSLVSGSKFYQYDFRKQTGTFTEAITANDTNGSLFYAPTITAQFTKLENNKKNELKLLAQNEVAALVWDNNGSIVLTGYRNGLTISEGSAATGQAYGDFAGFTVTLTGGEPMPHAYISSSAVVSSLIQS